MFFGRLNETYPSHVNPESSLRESFKCQQKDDITVETVRKERFVWERLREILAK